MSNTPPELPSADKSPDRISSARPLESDLTSHSSPGNFQSYMNQPGAAAGPAGQQGATGPTPMELSRSASAQPSGPPTMDRLMQQAKSAQDGLGVVEDQVHTLKNSNARMKRSQSDLLKAKLGDVRDQGKAVAEKIGATVPEAPHPNGSGSLEKVLSYIGDGQNQFISVQNKLAELSAGDQAINPADMLLIQSKMGIAQQEIEYSSTLLGKVMSSVTTIMNIQL